LICATIQLLTALNDGEFPSGSDWYQIGDKALRTTPRITLGVADLALSSGGQLIDSGVNTDNTKRPPTQAANRSHYVH
jgi:hypothetical protein